MEPWGTSGPTPGAEPPPGPAPSSGRSTAIWLAIVAGVLAVLGVVAALGVYAVVKAVDRLDTEADRRAGPNAPATAPPVTPPADPAPGTGACQYTAAADTGGKGVGLPPAPPAVAMARTVTIASSIGPIALRLDPKAPCTAHSFAFLAGKKYFDGSSCHRLTTEGIFVLQCGDPTGTGSGGPGYQFSTENPPAGPQPVYPAGTLAMANSGSPDSNGSQFFVVYQDTRLSPDYTVFGTVTQGLDAIQRAAAAGHDGSLDPGPGGGKPKTPVTLQTVTVR